MQPVSTVFHLMGALRRAIGRVVLWFFVTGIVGALIVEVVGFAVTTNRTGYHPSVLTNVAAIAIGVILAYAAALTVLVGEVIRFVVGSAQKAEQQVKTDLSGGAKFIDAAVQAIEHHEKN